MKPLVSIVIPVYNGTNYMRQAIDSALAQTYDNCEIIVVNDGSTDQGQTHEVASSYGSAITYIQKENGGVATALNTAIAAMNGEYFSWLSHDDLYKSDKIEKQVAFVNQHGQDIIPYTDYDTIDASGNVTSQFIHPPHEPSQKHLRVRMLMSLPMNGCTLFIRASHFKKVGPFNPKLRYTQDWDMWFRLAKHFLFMHQDQILIESRIHPHQDSATQITTPEEYTLFRNVILDLSEEELSEYKSVDSALASIALRLVRAPRRCSAAPVAYQRYKDRRKFIHPRDVLKVIAYQAGRLIRTRQGYLWPEGKNPQERGNHE